MKFVVLSSGSKGNCSALITERGVILIDCGISFTKIKQGLEANNSDIADVKHCIITHEHTDHVKGLKTLTNKYPSVGIYLTKGTQLSYIDKFKHELPNPKVIDSDSIVEIGGINFDFFPTMHDARESIGFSFEFEDNKFGYLTDCGEISSHISEKLENSTYLALESNYCPTMLANGSYPEFLKDRVSGSRGHLSNNQAAEFLKNFSDDLKYVCLMHLSENNNNPTIAENISKQVLPGKTVLKVASQNNGAEIIKII